MGPQISTGLLEPSNQTSCARVVSRAKEGACPGGRQRPKFKHALADTSTWEKSAEIKAEGFSSLNYHFQGYFPLGVDYYYYYFFLHLQNIVPLSSGFYHF